MILYSNNEITVRLLDQRDEQLLVKWLNNVEILQYLCRQGQPSRFGAS
jgi:aminoglycoside 6'-N-acetyltransferase